MPSGWDPWDPWDGPSERMARSIADAAASMKLTRGRKTAGVR
jgi:hypothetical protein